jgi:beta-galactosidase/beta-glucuronidase
MNIKKTALKLVAKVFILALMLSSCSTGQKIELISLKNGAVVNNNMPSLLWATDEVFSSFEIYIDNRRMDSISGNNFAYTPFPLAFGKHTWQVIGIKDGKRIASPIESFRVHDKYFNSTKTHNSIYLREDWKMVSSAQINQDGTELSGQQVNTDTWAATSVPVTVLSALVQNGLYPNPYIGINNMYIPDCNDEYNKENDLLKYSHIKGENPWKKPYWFRTEFSVPDSLNGKLIWLNIGEINYRAEVWLNGQQIADTSEMVGMDRSFRFNITKIAYLGKPNFLAIAIFPTDNPGKPDPEPLTTLGDPGTNMADGLISKDYTKWDALGWDWQPAVRDRDMGITEEVYIQITDEIEISNLYVTSDLQLPDTSYANITISADIINHSNVQKETKLKFSIWDNDVQIGFEQNVSIGPNSGKSLVWDYKSIKELQIKNPKLWWPIGYGNPNLYALKIEASASDGDKAMEQLHFGIRKVETYIGKKARVYKINGKDIYMKGGNWVMDMMLNWTASRYEKEILLTKNSNLNFLRVWGPTGAPPSIFFEAADKHGILIWQDFLNDYWGTFKNQPGYLPNAKLFEQATIAIVKKYRNHPSLVIWCGGNEGPNPREKLIMEKILPSYDGRDSKHYLKISNGDGLHGGGPYHTLKPAEYFTHHQLNGFSSEIGPSGVPVYQSVKKFITNLGEETDETYFPLNGQWAFHDASDRASDSRKFSLYDQIVRTCYGKPTDIEDYLNKCQLVNYEAYRASIEAINHQIWESASGIALWKSNSSWPSLTWQIYDWYLQAHGGYYGTKKAGEPVHVQLNRHNMQIVVLNSTFRKFENARISATQYNQNLEIIWEKDTLIKLAESAVTNTGWTITESAETSFLKIFAHDDKGNLISENFYWLNSADDFVMLKDLPVPKLTGKATKTENNDEVTFTVEIGNTGKGMAFMTSIYLKNRRSNQEVLPSYYSDNYISLLPGEKKSVTIRVHQNDLFEDLIIECKPYNAKSKVLINIIKD